ncbi:MAG: enoyl-CoA hydratase/isomerase family protein [Natronomonas sp.]
MTDPPYECITYEVDDRVARIQLDRPSSLNALNAALLSELEDGLRRANSTDDVRVVVLGGNGRAFSAGYDIGLDEPDHSVDENVLDQRTHLETIVSLQLPVIAAVDGLALAGGCNLAICCDLTFATESATFGYPDMHFGEPPPKFVLPFVTSSLKHARELLYSGKTINANDAQRMGLVNRVVPDDDLESTIEAELDEIYKTPSMAVAMMKDMINDVQETQGYRRYGRIDEFLGTLTMESETPTRFRKIRDEEGLEAALEWMHETDKD